MITEEEKLKIKAEREEINDADDKRDAQLRMTWVALWSLVLYPFVVILTSIFAKGALTTLSAIAGPYFIAVGAIIAAFWGYDAWTKNKNSSDE